MHDFAKIAKLMEEYDGRTFPPGLTQAGINAYMDHLDRERRAKARAERAKARPVRASKKAWDAALLAVSIERGAK